VDTPPPLGTEILLFVIFSEWDRFPVEMGAYNRQIEELTFEGPFYGRVLEGIEFIPSGAIDQAKFEDDGIATYESGAVVIAEWFGDCWHAAHGRRFPVPAFIEHHDSADAYDLHARCWGEEESIWD
jgi:hypothetical protein